MAGLQRFPKLKLVAPVYAMIVLMIYSWTILWFFWKLPSWLFFMNFGEIILNFIYSVATNFLESVFVVCAPILLCILLPRRWFHDLFVSRGTSLVVAGLGYMMYLSLQFQTRNDYLTPFLKPWSLALAGASLVLIVFLAGKIHFFKKVLEVIADQATIFLYITVPISVLSVVVVLVHSVI